MAKTLYSVVGLTLGEIAEPHVESDGDYVKGMDVRGPWPEHWVDTGCRHAPSCLNCPFEVCTMDDPWVVRRTQTYQRNKETVSRKNEAKALKAELNLNNTEIAVRLGVSRQSVSYYLKD